MLHYSISSLLSPEFPLGPTLIFSPSISFQPVSPPSLFLSLCLCRNCSDVKCHWTCTYQKYPTQSEHLSLSPSLLYLYPGFLTLRIQAPAFTAAPLPFSHSASFSCHSSDSSLHILPPPLPDSFSSTLAPVPHPSSHSLASESDRL